MTKKNHSLNPFATVKEDVPLSREVADEVRHTTCYMCACRCGIKVYLKDGTVRYIEGNPDHPVNRGVLCAKGSAGIMNHYSPARLTAPLLRVGERGKGEFKEISWEEALNLATQWLQETRDKNPNKLAFYTGRDQSQSLTGWWAAQYGTHNFAAHGGFCSVNMAAAGLYSVGGAFWEFGEPDWERTKYFLLFGVAEDHDSNPIKIGLGNLKARKDTKIVSINPVRTGYSAIADEWLAITPGTDGLLICALIHELMRNDWIDVDYLARYTNACYLVQQRDDDQDGLFWRDANQNIMVADSKTGNICPFSDIKKPALTGQFTAEDGTKLITVFELLSRRYLAQEYAPETVAEQTGISAATMRRIAAEIAHVAFKQSITINEPWTDWRGVRHESITGRPVSLHAMRGISAHSNGFQTCRSLHILQMLIGSIDVPGGWRYKAPYPKAIPPGPKPTQGSGQPNTPLSGMPIGNPTCPEDLLVDDAGNPIRLDKAYSWEHPLASHGLMHMVLHNAWAGDPHEIDVLFMYMANMAWNSSMNVADTIKYLTDKKADGSYKIPKFIYSDAYYSETVSYADLILPDTTYLERYDCISLLDRPISNAEGPADAIRVPIQQPDRDVRPFQDVLLDLGVRLHLPKLVDMDNKPLYPLGYADYMVNHQRAPGIGPLAGWRSKDQNEHGVGDSNPDQIQRYIENGCFWQHTLPLSQQFYKFANQEYIAYAQHHGWLTDTQPIVLQLYSEHLQRFRLAAHGHGKVPVPKQHRERILRYFDPLPIWYEPLEQERLDSETYPLHAVTQRPMHMYHSWGSQNTWLRQITNENALYIHEKLAHTHNLQDGDWAWLISHHGKIRVPVRIQSGVNEHTVWTWNAIGKRKGAWGLSKDAPESRKAFLLNHLISELLPQRKGESTYSNSDPITGQAAWYDLRVRIEKCNDPNQTGMLPEFDPLPQYKARSEIDLSTFGKHLKGKIDTKPPTTAHEWISHKGSRNL